MALHKDLASRERILLYGGFGSGKSHCWGKIGEYLRRGEPMGRVFVGDTDMAAERVLEGWDDAGANIFPTDLEGWDDYMAFVVKSRAMGKADDWLVVDMVDKAWDTVQGEFVDKAFGKDIDEWFLEFRKDHPEGGHALAGSYGTNWTVINKMYQKWIMNVLRFPGHVLLISPADPVQEPGRDGKGGDSEVVRDLYGRTGFKPKGQKSLGHQMSTVIFMQTIQTRETTWKMTSIKDRNRELMKGADNKDFVMDYLVRRAGWKL